MNIDHIDYKIINLLVEGNQVAEIAATTKRSARYVLYRLSDLKTSFNCKTTVQLIYMLITEGHLKLEFGQNDMKKPHVLGVK